SPVSRRPIRVQRRAVGANDLDAADGGSVRAGNAPDRIVDLDRAGAPDNRLLQREDAADESLGAAVEERLVALVLDPAANTAPGDERDDGEDRERAPLR